MFVQKKIIFIRETNNLIMALYVNPNTSVPIYADEKIGDFNIDLYHLIGMYKKRVHPQTRDRNVIGLELVEDEPMLKIRLDWCSNEIKERPITTILNNFELFFKDSYNVKLTYSETDNSHNSQPFTLNQILSIIDSNGFQELRGQMLIYGETIVETVT